MLRAIIHIAVLVSVTKHHVNVGGRAWKQNLLQLSITSNISLDNQGIH
jgi:hypothetical protein